MSTNSYSQYCYFCGAEDSAMICEDSKPPSLDFTCIECGMSSVTKWYQMDLGEINMYREDMNEKPIKQLRKALNV